MPLLHKKNCRPQRLRSKHFIYDFVEDTNVRKREPIQLILTKYVAALGNIGTQVSMPPNKAYKKFLLPRLADYATPENIEKYTKLALNEEYIAPFSSISVEKTMKYLSRKRLIVLMSRDISWTLEKWHIRTNFRKLGIVLPEDAITMPEKTISGPNLELEGKEFYVTVTINQREQVKVTCCLNHWNPSKIAEIHTEELLELPSEPIFPEDKPVLDSLSGKKNENNKTE